MWNDEFILTLKDLTAGTIGACAGIAVGHPLDLVKVRLQQNPSLYRSGMDCLIKTVRGEGPLALYAGLTSPLVGNAPLNAIVFGVNGYMMRLLDKRYPRPPSDPNKGGTVSEGHKANRPEFGKIYAAAFVAGAAQIVVCTPVELIKCKLQVQGELIAAMNAASSSPRSHPPPPPFTIYQGPWAMMKGLYSTGGPLALYRGFWITFWRDAPSYGVWFVVFEGCKWALSPSGQAPSTPALLAAGGAAGIATWLSTYPLDCIKSVVQTMPDNAPRADLRMGTIAKRYYEQYGIKWFFAGLVPTLVRAVPVSAVTFYVYEKSLQLMNRKGREEKQERI